MNAIFELWSRILPERSLACSFNLEYLLVGGQDRRDGARAGRDFMWYDWLAGGWGGRVDRDGSNTTAPVFGVGLALQSCEVQEQLAPITITELSIRKDSAGPGRYRGGVGLDKGGVVGASNNVVMSYCCDRARSVTWGIQGGLPSIPHGVWVNPESDQRRFLGVVFAGEPLKEGDLFTRPAAGGGGFGDPLLRDPAQVLEDVIDDYVSIERAAKDYGVVIHAVDPEICAFKVDEAATYALRSRERELRKQRFDEKPEDVRAAFLSGDIDELDLIRRYGVVLDFTRIDAPVLPITTRQLRERMLDRSVGHWA